MSTSFLELDRTVLFLSKPLAPHGEVAKALRVVRLATKKLLVSVDAVAVLELLAKTLADKDMASWPLCCKIVYLLGICKGLKAFSYTLEG